MAQLKAQQASAAPQAQSVIQDQIKNYQALAQDQSEKKKVQQADADNADQTYNELNFHDDQFDLSDAMLAIAISLLAVTALTQKRWLFFIAMVPTFFGVLMGLAGLLGWHVHPDFLDASCCLSRSTLTQPTLTPLKSEGYVCIFVPSDNCRRTIRLEAGSGSNYRDDKSLPALLSIIGDARRRPQHSIQPQRAKHPALSSARCIFQSHHARSSDRHSPSCSPDK